MSERNIPNIAHVVELLHQRKRDTISGRGRRPEILMKEWSELNDSERGAYEDTIQDVVFALRIAGIFVGSPTDFQIIPRRKALRVAVTKHNPLRFTGG